MFKLDDNFLQEIGLGALPPQDKNPMLQHIYETLELRVGMRLAEQMSDAQLQEFESFIEKKDEQGALKWLETNLPNYKDVVAEELNKLKEEIKGNAPQIVAQAQAAAANPQPPTVGYPPQPAYPPQPGYAPAPGAYPPQPAYAQPPQPGYAAPQPAYPPQPGYAPAPQQPSPSAPGPASQPSPTTAPQPQPPAAAPLQPVEDSTQTAPTSQPLETADNSADDTTAQSTDNEPKDA
ncbi:MAG: DUF5663 domain-containing protein [Patescibacteria group bacterium]